MQPIHLRIIDGPRAGEFLQNLQSPVSIGREAENSISLQDHRVSRFHARIKAGENGLTLEDLHSTNGTLVNDTPVEFCDLQVGDQITIGKTIMLLGSDQQLDDFESDFGTVEISRFDTDHSKGVSVERLTDSAAQANRRVPNKLKEPSPTFEKFTSIIDQQRWVPIVNRFVAAAKRHSSSLQKSLDELPKVSRYRLIALIGRGAMAKVFAAWDELNGEPVAIKLFEPRHENVWSLIQRFQNEAAAMERLDHPNVVSLRDRGNHQGRAYIVMNLIIGKPLSVYKKIWSGDLPPADSDTEFACEEFLRVEPGSDFHYHLVGKIGLTVSKALENSHSKGILHRDIKPSNILIGQNGKIWLTDFGLANVDWCADGETLEERLTQCGDLLGTINYMSVGAVDGRYTEQSDLYSLGATLGELATLQPCWGDKKESEILKGLFNEDPPPFLDQQQHPQVPAELCQIINCLFDAEVATKRPTAAQMAESLRCFVAGEPVSMPKGSSEFSVRARRIYRRWFPRGSVKIFAATWLGLVLATAAVLGFQRYNQALAFDRFAGRLHDGVKLRLDQSAYSVKLLRQFVTNVTELDEKNFTAFATPILANSPEVKLVGLAQQIEPDESVSVRPLCSKNEVDDGEPDNSEANNGKGDHSEADDSEPDDSKANDSEAVENDNNRSIVVTRVSPNEFQDSIIGTDLLSDASLAEAIKQSNFSGEAVLAGPVLVDDEDAPLFAFVQKIPLPQNKTCYIFIFSQFSEILRTLDVGQFEQQLLVDVHRLPEVTAEPIYQGDENGQRFPTPSSRRDYRGDLTMGNTNWSFEAGLLNPADPYMLSTLLKTFVAAVILPVPMMLVWWLMRRLGR